MSWTFYNSSGESMVTHAESEATKAEMEAETAVAHFVPPALVKNSPGVAKAWCRIEANGTISGGTSYPNSYNIASVSTSTGSRTIAFTTDFSQTVYSAVGQLMTDSSNTTQIAYSSPAVGQIVCQIYSSGSLVDDRITGHAFFGDHA